MAGPGKCVVFFTTERAEVEYVSAMAASAFGAIYVVGDADTLAIAWMCDVTIVNAYQAGLMRLAPV